MSIKKLPIQKEKINPQGIEKVMWDAIVIGTGMGGSTVGYCLGKSGYKVLFVESGDFKLFLGVIDSIGIVCLYGVGAKAVISLSGHAF